MAIDRVISPEPDRRDAEESRTNRALRPRRLADYVGQPRLVEKLGIAIAAARGRDEPLDPVLLHGPPGLGKTTLAHVIAREMGSQVHVTSGPALTRPGDLVGMLTRLQSGDVLFIDEIHRLPAAVEECLYAAMEDFQIDVPIDQGMHARSVLLTLAPFSLLGATTRAGLVSSPLRSRFGIVHHLEFYSDDELREIVRRSAALLEIPSIEEAALGRLAGLSRGTPRVVNRLLRRARDWAQVHREGRIDAEAVAAMLAVEGIDDTGLDDLDRRYLEVLASTYGGGPVGVEALAATLNEDARTLEDVVEPYLLKIGFVARTRRGRQITSAAASFLGRPDLAPDSGAVVAEPDADGLFGSGP